MLSSLAAALFFLATPAAAARNPAQEAPVTRLSALRPHLAAQGWGRLGVDRSVQESPLRIGERSFAHGLGTHAHSELVYLLGGGYERFRAWVGVDAEVAAYAEASVVFQVRGDGRVLFASSGSRPLRRASSPGPTSSTASAIGRRRSCSAGTSWPIRPT
ncbi:MAG: NPCBM/NEW2 domain-containing protein [Planctomycetota bacterium]